MPDEVKTATEGYREEMDTFSSFIDECCIRHFAPLRHLQSEFIDGENWYLSGIKRHEATSRNSYYSKYLH